MIVVKHGDKYPVTYTLNMDLTGATVRLIAQVVAKDADPVELDVTPANPADGTVTHTLTGTLPVGTYNVEAEVSIGGDVITFPTDQRGRRTFDTLVVVPDID